MKTLGLVGGTGWVSTVDYYRFINQGINKALGGHQNARCVMVSLNFGDIVAMNRKNDTEGIAALLLDAALKTVAIGAEGVLLCANTLHKFADRIQKEIDVPLIHIADATAGKIQKKRLTRVGLLGTKYTMEEDFYTARLQANGIQAVVPDDPDRAFVHKAIFDELVKEIFKKETKERYLDIMEKLRRQGAQGIILGCTEIPLIIHDDDFDLPLFNTTEIHARAAVDFALGTS